MTQRRGAHVQLTGVSKSFADRLVLRDLTLSIAPGEFVSVVGRSGSGKTTLLRLLCALEAPSQGQVRILDAAQRDASEEVRVVFQEHRLLPWRSVLQNVLLGTAHGDQERARAVLSQVGLADRLSDYPAVLSGGQRQRVALARALLHSPAMLLLDEPFGALDALTRIEAQALVERLWRAAGFTVLLVTHDVQEAVVLSDRVLVVEDGAIVDSLQVTLERPRRRDHPEVGRLTARLLDRVIGRTIPRERATPEPQESSPSSLPTTGKRLFSLAE